MISYLLLRIQCGREKDTQMTPIAIVTIPYSEGISNRIK